MAPSQSAIYFIIFFSSRVNDSDFLDHTTIVKKSLEVLLSHTLLFKRTVQLSFP